MADRLRQRGASVAVPSLRQLAADGPPYAEPMAEAVAAAARASGDDDVVLVGHSGAGPLLPAAGRRVGRCAAYLFVDAALPHPGRSRLASVHPSFQARLAELLDGEFLPPWSEWFDPHALDALLPDEELRTRFRAELDPVPADLLREPLPEVAGWPDAPCGFLRLSRAYDGEEAEAARQGWAVASLPGSHLSPVVDPDGVAAALVSLAGRWGVSL
ncbi:MAG TPA: hypothetical protein VM938_08500 [Acidimicrobiales bacterium]|nr:hypothetical protein [Acidimicrobiales bacterium]